MYSTCPSPAIEQGIERGMKLYYDSALPGT